MNLVVSAHTPPPLHRQSYMVQLMVEVLGGARRSGHNQGRGSAYEIHFCEKFTLQTFHSNFAHVLRAAEGRECLNVESS